jgi:hypothetical protein
MNATQQRDRPSGVTIRLARDEAKSIVTTLLNDPDSLKETVETPPDSPAEAFKPVAIPEQGQLLLDMRDVADHSPIFSEELRQQVFSQVFERGNYRSCDPAFNLTPSLEDEVTGFFTSAEVVQTAYLVSVGDGCASASNGFHQKVLAIFENGQFVTMTDSTGFDRILTVKDINEDGLEELVLMGESTETGFTVSRASVFGHDPNGADAQQITHLMDLGNIDRDNTGVMGDRISRDAASIHYMLVDQTPQYYRSIYHSECVVTQTVPFKSECEPYTFVTSELVTPPE